VDARKILLRINVKDRRVRYVVLGAAAVVLPFLLMPSRQAPPTMVARAATTSDAMPAAAPSIDLDKVKPNEAGVVPILMYHNIIGDKIYQMKYPVSMFRSDLQWLYDHNYRPVSLTQFVQGKIDCPAGMSPVIITFDDGDKSQFDYLPNGSIDPNCAVAIMDKFHDDHPDWVNRATFFIIAGTRSLPAPFYQRKTANKKLEYLVKEGYDIGNHTVHHPMMNKLSTDAAMQEIAVCAASLENSVPGYDVNTLALPYGLFPKDSAVLPSGSYDGKDYSNVCAMAAGWSPAPSPIDKNFHRYELERIQAGNEHFQSHWWLNWLESHKSRKFVSDGDPTVFTVPASVAAKVDKTRLAALGVEMKTYGAPAHVAKKKTHVHVLVKSDKKASTRAADVSKSKKGLTPVKPAGYTPAHN
jgi:peptidoglycan/xylan/chitin deacetylase (PgdA/CDA1 family)